PAPARPAQASGGSRLGENFLEGAGSSTSTSETRVPASQIGASAKASIIQAIIRQIRPHWSAPQGVDAELLVTQLSFRLNPDGSLNGRPRVVSQSGVTDSNRPQQDLHAERAIRAVQLAAPFDLPAEYYNAWQTIDGARFDRNLAR
ncbi:MAG: TonB C-terminal domain-containing protein, partial [Alphaproteobacteria bacterium]|nr:TonB C-terminal domain-containing protein [Alphaproteobacteria bacterium]